MQVERLTEEHLDRLQVQGRQVDEFMLWPPGALSRLLEHGEGFAGVRDEEVLAVAGVVRIWPGRWQAWAFVGGAVGPAGFLAVHRAVLGYLERSDAPRIEASCEQDFDAAHRWLRMLGMQLETPAGMRAYLPNGAAASLYSRAGGRYQERAA
jgi:hypothetical protein